MTWLIEKLGGKLAAYAVMALVGIVIAVLLLGVGFWTGYQWVDNKAQIKMLTTQVGQLTQNNTSLQDSVEEATRTIQQMEVLRSENAQLTLKLAEAQAKAKSAYGKLREQLTAEKDEAFTVSGSSPAVCAFTGKFVRLWNAALVGDDAASTVGLPDAAGGTVDTTAGADLAEAKVSGRDILSNHIDNNELNSANRKQCDALIEWHHAHDKK